MSKLKWNEKSAKAWEKAWDKGEDKGNIGSSISAIGGGLTGVISAGLKNAEIKDTSEEEAEIESIGATQFGSGSFDNLLENFDATSLAKTNFSGKELRGLTGGQMALNTLGGIASGAAAGAKVGGPWGAVAGGVIGLGSGLAGIFTGNAKANKKALALNSLAEEANRQYLNNFNNAVSNTQNTMFNNSLLNIASYGGPLFNLGGEFSNGLTFINEGSTHEVNPLGGVMVGVDQEGTPNLVEEGEIIYNDYVFSNRLKPTKKQLADGGFTDKYNDWTFAKIVEDLQKESAERPNDIISKVGLDDMMNRIMIMQEETRMKKKAKQTNKFSKGGKVNILDGNEESQNLSGLYFDWDIEVEDLPIEIEEPEIDTTNDVPTPVYFHVNDDGKAESISDYEFKKRLKDGTAMVGDEYKPKSKLPWQSALRYASPIIHGILLANNLQKPDYSAEKALMKKANSITRGSYTPLGNTLNLELVDRNVYTNPILANAAASRRTIIENSPNAGAAVGALLAQNAITNDSLGTAAIKGTQANNETKSKAAQFYLTRDQANADLALRSLVMDQQADQIGLSAMANAMQSMNSKNATRNQAISSEVEGLTSDLGSIGREAIDLYNYNKLIDKGYIPKGWTEAKNGGMLTRKRRRK